jgi:hypothetical protein
VIEFVVVIMENENGICVFLHSFRGRRSIAEFSASVKMTAVGLGAAAEEDSRCGCVHARSSSICSLSAKSALVNVGWVDNW